MNSFHACFSPNLALTIVYQWPCQHPRALLRLLPTPERVPGYGHQTGRGPLKITPRPAETFVAFCGLAAGTFSSNARFSLPRRATWPARRSTIRAGSFIQFAPLLAKSWAIVGCGRRETAAMPARACPAAGGYSFCWRSAAVLVLPPVTAFRHGSRMADNDTYDPRDALIALLRDCLDG